MLQWLKNNHSVIIAILVTVGFLIYCYGCEAKTSSLSGRGTRVNRQELQLELDQIITMAQIGMADLEQQEQFRSIVLQNALVLVQGQPLNPFGIISAIAAVYGISQGSTNITKVVKDKKAKRRENNA